MPTGPLARAFEALGDPSTGELSLQAHAARTITDLHRTARTLGWALGHTATGNGQVPAGKATSGGALATQLDVVARCVEMGAPTQAYSVSVGGFDTHTAERATQQRLPSAQLAGAFTMHDQMLLQQTDAYAAKDYQKAHDIANSTYDQMYDLAGQLSEDLRPGPGES